MNYFKIDGEVLADATEWIREKRRMHTSLLTPTNDRNIVKNEQVKPKPNEQPAPKVAFVVENLYLLHGNVSETMTVL